MAVQHSGQFQDPTATNLQAMVSTVYNAVGGTGVFVGPDGENSLMEAMANVNSKTKVLAQQDVDLDNTLKTHKR